MPLPNQTHDSSGNGELTQAGDGELAAAPGSGVDPAASSVVLFNVTLPADITLVPLPSFSFKYNFIRIGSVVNVRYHINNLQ